MYKPTQSLLKILTGMLLAGVSLSACKKDDPQSKESINTFSLTVQNQLNGSAATALCLVNLTEGKAYNAADATNNQAKVDFVYYQYTGTAVNKDSYFYGIGYLKNHPSGYEQSIRDALGIQSWATITGSVITRTKDIKATDFDAINNLTDLRSAFDRVTNTRAVIETITAIEGLPVDTIFAFEAANSKIGLMKLKTARTGTGGGIDIDIKVEK